MIFTYTVLCSLKLKSQDVSGFFIAVHQIWLPHPLKRHRLAFGQWKLQWTGLPGEESKNVFFKKQVVPSLLHLFPTNEITQKSRRLPHPTRGVLSQVRLGSLKFVCLWSGRPLAKTQQLNLAGLNQLKGSWWQLLLDLDGTCYCFTLFHMSSFFVWTHR